MAQYNLLSVGKDAKTVKGEKVGYLTGIIYLQPASMSGVNLCRGSSAGCREACLFTAGMSRFSTVKAGRARKTRLFNEDRDSFMRLLKVDLETLQRVAIKRGMRPVMRINGTSDIPWETITFDGKTIFEHCPLVNFMDYTKIARRMFADSPAQKIPNYHLTFSRSESNEAIAQTVAAAGKNVAVVFPKGKLPKKFWGYPVVNGDINDLRFLDKKGVIVGLSAKGKAKKDMSGFVVNVG